MRFMLGKALSLTFATDNMLIRLLRPFADAVKAGVASFMCSYNLLNNSQACQNSYLLNHILKEELGFQYVPCPQTALRKAAM
jgi:beta-glucosidase